MEAVLSFLHEENNTAFDGQPFSIFGRGMEQVANGDEIEWIQSAYYTDSVVLCPKDNPNEYFKFFIRCVDSNGNIIELE
jgi:hypothetical protein